MIKNQFIRKITAALMLIVFAVSITPVIVFHDAFANHTDSVKKTTDINKEQVGQKLFNCHCNHIVAESPFTGSFTINMQYEKQFFVIVNADKPVQFSSATQISCSLRGPPVV